MILNFDKIVNILKDNPLISQISDTFIDELNARSIYRIKCNLTPKKYNLSIKIIHIESDIIYSYQLFSDKPLIRWDNAPHYPNIKSFPHHFHSESNKVISSKLTGRIEKDINIVLTHIKIYINDSI
jgi:hypothetical protein